MTDLRPVEKTLTMENIQQGSLSFTRLEADRLALPAHAGSVPVRCGDQAFSVYWASRQRIFGGEELAELFQLEASNRHRVILSRTSSAGEIELALVEVPQMQLLRPIVIRKVEPKALPQARVRQRLRDDRYRVRSHDEFLWQDGVGVDTSSVARLKQSIDGGTGWDTAELFGLRLTGETLAAVNDFDELLAFDLAKVEHMPHQEAVATTVLARMRGRAILADEVGLGKTIEAGLVLKELVLRGLVRRVLILCPSTLLRDQWREELDEKFDETFTPVTSSKEAVDGDRVIMTTHLAARDQNASRLAEQSWDLVILDEAHRLGGGAKKLTGLLRSLQTRYLLFLTATPVQNDLVELYNLVEVLRPGTFRSKIDFKRQHQQWSDPRQPKDPAGLRKLISDVMVRTTREQAGLERVSRRTVEHPVPLSAAEREAYSLCTSLLRTVMTSPGDHLRRLHLAHRLTTSPRALGLSALKMARTHPQAEARRLLTDLGELCFEFGTTPRQAAFVELAQSWIAEKDAKGRLLVFTQHTNTLEDLLRVLGNAGIDARPFHGGMSASAKTASVDAFRNGVPVMVSTDAGAEGLNLQFANCVVNFDLPWNPMRIEQRIGRVHRLTQERDVHVANFFTRDPQIKTIDEQVYWLLRDKLHMFELLFGQVTTVLGELADDVESFESTIMHAYLADDDQEMVRRLEALGQKVDSAYQSAQGMIRTGSHINRWHSERPTATPVRRGKSSRELVPKHKSKRERQNRVRSFVREYLRLNGAEITYDKEHFLSAAVPEALRAELGGRDELHVGFTSESLEQHRDAELCAVGSEVFDDLVASLSQRGDLLARMPPIPTVDNEPWVSHGPGVRLLSRRILGPSAWGAEATWRVRISGTGGGDEIVYAQHRSPDSLDSEVHADYAAGRLPESIGGAADVVDTVVESSMPGLSAARQRVQKQLDVEATDERRRMVAYWDRKLDERNTDLSYAYSARIREECLADLAQWEAARARYVDQAAEQAEAQAQLLALRVVGSRKLAVVETWQRLSGIATELHFEWIPGEPAEYYGADNCLIDVLDICDHGHPVNSAGMRECPSCASRSCRICDFAYTPCVMCGIVQCRSCVAEEVCSACEKPVRAENLDDRGMRGWMLRDALLLVGENVAEIRREDGTVTVVCEDESVPVIRSLARLLGARPDLGVRLEPTVALAAIPAAALAWTRRTSMEWWADSVGGARADPSAVSLLSSPIRPDPSGEVSTAVGAEIIRRCRRECPPAPAPQVVATPTVVTTWCEIGAAGIQGVTRTEQYGRAPELRVEPIVFAPVPEDQELVGTARSAGADLELRRLHRSYVLTVSTGSSTTPYFVAAADALSEGTERALDALRRRLGDVASTVVSMAPAVPEPARFATPAAATLIERSVEPVWIPAARVENAVELDDGSLNLIGVDAEAPNSVALGPEATSAMLSTAHALDPPAARHAISLVRHHRITETWRGRSTATRMRMVGPGASAMPVLDDTRRVARSFGVDSFGHLYKPEAGWECPACLSQRCGACGPEGVMGPCPLCSQPACGACRSSDLVLFADQACELCGTHTCGVCRPSIGASVCPICRRTTCRDCWDGDTCATCASLVHATPKQVGTLPDDLHARGLDVRMSRSGHVVVASLAGAARREFAVVVDGAIRDWWTMLPVDPSLARLVLGLASPGAGTGNIAISSREEGSLPPRRRGEVVLRERSSALVQWELRRARHPIAARTFMVAGQRRGSAADLLSEHEGLEEVRIPIEAPGALLPILEQLVPTLKGRAVAELLLSASREVDRIELGLSGLRHTSSNGIDSSVRGSDWSTEPDAALWPSQPTADAFATAHIDDVSVTLLRFGPYGLLVSDIGGERAFGRLDDLPGFPESILLGFSVGVGDPLLIGAFADPAFLVPPTIARGVLKDRILTPRVDVTDQAADPDLLHRAVAAWVPAETGAQFHELGDQVLQQPAILRLRKQIDLPKISNPVRIVALGIDVSETWTTPRGTVEVRYALTAGQSVGQVKAFDTGAFVTVATIDDLGHIVERAVTCGYCDAVSCGGCPNPVSVCMFCAIEVCGGCIPDRNRPLCRACSALISTTWLQRRRRQLHQAWALLGHDEQHDVLIVPSVRGIHVTATFASGVETQQDLRVSQRTARTLNRFLGRQILDPAVAYDAPSNCMATGTTGSPTSPALGMSERGETHNEPPRRKEAPSIPAESITAARRQPTPPPITARCPSCRALTSVDLTGERSVCRRCRLGFRLIECGHCAERFTCLDSLAVVSCSGCGTTLGRPWKPGYGPRAPRRVLRYGA